MSTIDPTIAFEHQIRDYIRGQICRFDTATGMVDRNDSVTVRYEHDRGDGTWSLHTWASGIDVTTKGAVLRDVMTAHINSYMTQQEMRALPSLLPAPEDK
jgi:hypothetical protein